MTALVYAATGWTGTLVAAALQRARVPFAIAGRSSAKCRALAQTLDPAPQIRIADVRDATALRRAMEGMALVINCVGPYTELGRPVLDAAIDRGCHYLDVSGEESYLARAHEHHDAAARRASVIVCPGFAAKGALGDWGAVATATAAGGGNPVDEVAVAYAHGVAEYFRPSVGSVLSAAGQGFFHAQDPDGDRAAIDRRFAFPPPFGPGRALLVPGAEDVSVPRHLAVRRVRSYLSMAPGSPVNDAWADLCVASLPFVPAISRYLLSEQGRGPLQRILAEPRRGRNTDTFAVAIEATRGQNTSRMGISTRDAYAVTADIVAYGAARLLAEKPTHQRGVLTPAQLFPAAHALGHLDRTGAMKVSRFRGQL